MRNIEEWSIVTPLKACPAGDYILNLFERSALVRRLPTRWSPWLWMDLLEEEGWNLSWPGWQVLCQNRGPSAKRKHFSPLNLGWRFQRRHHGLLKGKKESIFEVIFLVMDLQEEHFLLISLSRHRTSPTGLASSSYNYPCSVTLAEDGEKYWELIPTIIQGQHGAVPWIPDLRLRWIQYYVLEDFWL